MLKFEQMPDIPGVEIGALASSMDPVRVRVDVVVLTSGSSLPKHRAGQDQVFHVVAGRGRVAGENDVQYEVGPGSVIEWESGEEHTLWADSDMTVVIYQQG